MSVKLALRFFSFLCVLIFKINCQEPGVPCETPDSRYGVCVPVKLCAEIVNLLTQGPLTPQKKNYIRSFQCDFQGGQTYVCCPAARPRNTDVFVPVNNGNGNENNNENTGHNNENNNNENNKVKLLKPPECGYSFKSDSRIVGGVPARLGEFPWIAALGYKNANNPQLTKWLCGGALITKRHVITAGHCIRDNLYMVRLGELDLYDDQDGAHPINVRIVQKRLHEDYNPSAHTNDVAILKLEEFQFPANSMIGPICLPWEDNLRAKSFERYEPFVAGWGSTNFNGPSSSILMKVALPVIQTDNCQAKYGTQAVIDQRIICAGYTTGGRDSCQGDSGGPMMLGTSLGLNATRFYLIGVVSYGFRCAEPGYPGVYSRVTEFLPWIQSHLD